MFKLFRFISLATVLSILMTNVIAQESMDKKTQKYVMLIKKHPENTSLFKRFYRQWLNDKSITEMEAFLKKESKEMKPGQGELLMAQFYLTGNQSVKALKSLELVIQKNPKSSHAYHLTANLQSLQVEFEKAAVNYQKAYELSKKESSKIKILKALGKIYIRNNKIKEADATFLKLENEIKGDLDLIEEIMEIQIEEGLYEQALKTSDKLINLAKSKYKKVLYHLRKGDIFLIQQKRKEAVAIYVASLDLVETDGWVELQIISQFEKAFRRSNDTEGLVKLYKEITAKYPKRYNLQKQYAIALHETEKTDEGLKIFKSILAAAPGDLKLKESFLGFLKKVGKYEELILQYESMIKENPKDTQLLIDFAYASHKGEKPNKVKKALDAYIALSKKGAGDYLRVANLYGRLGKDDEALKTIESGLVQVADSYELKEAKIDLLFSKEITDSAIAELKKLTKIADEGGLLRLVKLAKDKKKTDLALVIIEENKSRFEKSYLINREYLSVLIGLKKDVLAYEMSQKLLLLTKATSDHWQACAQIYLMSQKLQKSDTLIEKLKKLKDDEKKNSLLIFLQYKTGLFDEAMSGLAASIKAQPKSLLLKETHLYIAGLKDDDGERLKAIQSILQNHPEKKILYLPKLVNLYLMLDQKKNALKSIEEWKLLQAGSTTPYLKESSIYKEDLEYKKAIQAVRKGLYKFDKNETLRKTLAKLYIQNNNEEDARNLYWVMIDDAETLSAKFSLFKDLSRLSYSWDHYEILLNEVKARHQKNKKSEFPLLAQAVIYGLYNNHEERRNALLKAAEISKDSILILHQLAKIEQGEYRFSDAIKTLERAGKLDKTHKTKQLIADVYFASGEEEKGVQALEEMISAKILDEKALIQFATNFFKRNKYEKTLSLIGSAPKKSLLNFRVRFLKALSLEESDKKELAMAEFLLILSMKELKVSNKKSQGNQRMGLYRALVPPHVFDFMNIAQSQHRAYSYKRKGTNRRFYGNQPVMFVPADFKTIKNHSLIHIARLSTSFDEEKKKALIFKLEANAIRNPEAILALGGERFDPSALTELAKKNPSEPLYFLFTMHDRKIKPTKKWQDDVKKRFGKKYPKLIVLAFMSKLWSAKKEQKFTLMNNTLDLLAAAKLEKKQETAIKLELIGSFRSRKLDDKIKERVLKIVESIDLTDKSLNVWSVNAAHEFLLNTRVESKDNEKILAMINKMTKKKNASSNRHYGRHSRNSGFPKLKWPMNNLPNVGYNIQNLFAKHGSKKLDLESFKPFAKKIDHSSLRFLAMVRCDYEEKVLKEEANKLLSSKDNQEVILGLSWIKHNDPESKIILSTLNKIRHLPMKLSKRKQIDSYILGESMDHLEDEKVKAVAKSVAIRFLRYQLNNQERKNLIFYFESLGMAKEVEKLDKKIAQANLIATRSSGSANINYSDIKRLKKLYSSGKKDVAIKIAAKLFRMQSIGKANFNSVQRNFYNNDNGLNSWIKENKTGKLLIKALQPKGSNKSRVVMMTLAFAEEDFGKSENAKEIYEKIIKKNPKDYAAKISLSVLGEKPTAENLSKIFESMDHNILQRSISYYLKYINTRQNGFEKTYKQISLLSVALNSQKKLKVAQIGDQLQGVFYQLENTYANNGGSVPRLYEKVDLSKYNNRQLSGDELKKLLELRFKAFSELCQLTFKSKSTAKKSFPKMIKYYQANEKDFEPLYEQAKKIVQLKSSASQNVNTRHHYSHGGSQKPLRAFTLEGFLFYYAYTKGKQDELKKLIASIDKDEAKDFKNYQLMYELPAEGFVEALSKAKFEEANNFGGQSEDQKYLIALWVVEDRKLKVDLYDSIFKIVKDHVKEENQQEQQLVNSYQQFLQITGKNKVTRKLFKDLYALYTKGVKADVKIDEDDWNDPVNRHINQLGQMLQKVCKSPDTLFAIFEEVEKMPILMNNLNYNANSFVNYETMRAIRLKHLMNSKVLKDLDAFRPYAFTDSDGEGLSSLIQINKTKAIGGSGKGKTKISSAKKVIFTENKTILGEILQTYNRKALREEVDDKYGPLEEDSKDGSATEEGDAKGKAKSPEISKNFGESIVYFRLNQKKKELIEYLDSRLEEIKKKDAHWQHNFSVLIKGFELDSHSSAEKSTYFNYVHEKSDNNIDELVKAFLAPKQISDVWDFKSKGSKLASSCLRVGKVDLAMQIARRVDKVSKRNDRRNYGKKSAFLDEYYEELNKYKSESRVEFAIKLIELAGTYSEINRIEERFGSFTYKIIEVDSAVAKDKRGQAIFDKYLKKLLEPCVKVHGDQFYFPFFDFHRRILDKLKKEKSLPLMKDWLANQKEKKAYLKELDLTFQHYTADKKLAPAIMKELVSFYGKHLKREDFKSNLAMNLAVFMMNSRKLKVKGKEVPEILLATIAKNLPLMKKYNERPFVALIDDWNIKITSPAVKESWRKVFTHLKKTVFNQPGRTDSTTTSWYKNGKDYRALKVKSLWKMIRLCQMHCDKDMLNSLMKSSRFGISKSGRLLPYLASKDFNDIFVQAFEKHWVYLKMTSDGFKKVSIKPETRIKINTLVSKITDPDVKFFAKVFMGQFPNSRKDKKNKKIKEEISKELESFVFKNESIKERVLLLLVTPALIKNPKYKKDFEKIREGISLKALLKSDRSLKSPLALFYLESYLSGLKQGEFEKFDKGLKPLYKSGGFSGTNKEKLSFYLFCKGVKEYKGFVSKAEVIFKRLYKQLGKIGHADSRERSAYRLTLICATLANKDDLIKGFKVKFTNIHIRHWKKSITPEVIFKDIEGLIAISSEKDKVKLKEAYKKMLSSEHTSIYLKPSVEKANLLKSLAKVYTKEEVAKLSELIDKIKK